VRAGLLRAIAVLGAAVLLLPPGAVVVRAVGAGLPADAGTGVGRAAGAAALVAAAATVLGLPLGWALARGRRLGPLRWVVVAPLLLPATLAVEGATALLGPAGLGVARPGGPPVVLLGHLVVALPLCALVVEHAVRGLDPAAEETATVHGLPPHRVLRHVTLPAAGPALRAGALLAFARALGASAEAPAAGVGGLPTGAAPLLGAAAVGAALGAALLVGRDVHLGRSAP
jgi:molybdate transport system permease protein